MTEPESDERTVPPRRPSRAHVAERARVSAQTVTRVIHGSANVDPKTRAAVVDAMRELGYRPNRAAQALRSGRFHNIGVVMFTLSSFGNIQTLAAISASAAAAGYAITLIPVRQPTQGGVSDALGQLRAQEVDGIVIVIEAHIVDEPEIALPPDLPIVVIDSGTRADYPMVDTDQAQGATLATEHLLHLGHETVWHVAGPEPSFSAARRRQAWRDVLEAASRPVPAILQGDWTAHSGYEAGRVIAADPDVTAVFAANDQMALGVLRALHEADRPVPASISVVGFDDTLESSSFWPPLTTIHQDFETVGRRSVETLIEEIETGRPGTVDSLVETRIVIRESTAPPPTSAGGVSRTE